MEHNKISLIDWLSFSLPVEYDWSQNSYRSVQPVLKKLFGLNSTNSFQQKAKWYHERHVIKAGNRTILTVGLHATAENNANSSSFSIPGHAFTNESGTDFDAVAIIRKVAAMGGKLTRLDLAIDFSDRATFDAIWDSAMPDVWRDRIKSPLKLPAPLPVGHGRQTLYFGKLKKGSQETALVLYDKANQQGVPGDWFRLELRTINRELLKMISEEFCAGHSVGEVTAGLINTYLKFVSPSCRDKYRRPIAPWWTSLIEEGAAFKFARHMGGKTEEEREHPKPPDPLIHKRNLKSKIAQDETGTILEATLQALSELGYFVQTVPEF